MAQSRLQQFQDLRPSFIGFGWGGLRDLAEAAYQQGAADISAQLRAGNSLPEVLANGVLADKAGASNWSMRHGHLPSGAPGVSAELSGICPWELSAQFKADVLEGARLTLFFLNPRFVFAERTFIPADVGPKQNFTGLTHGPAPCGLVLLSDPEASPQQRFRALTEGLPQAALDLAQVPTGFAPFDQTTLSGRIDVKLVWKLDTAGAIQQDTLGRVIGIPEATVPSGITFNRLSLFSPALADHFNGLLLARGGLGLHLRGDASGSGPIFILNQPKNPGSSGSAAEKEVWEKYRTAVTEFGLTADFKGMLFEGIEVHWLTDNNVGHGLAVKMGLSALSFGSGTTRGRTASWYTSFEAEVTISETNTYLALLSSVKLRAVLAENEPQSVALIGTFNQLDYPYTWLSNRAARLSMRLQKWKDAAGAEHESNVYDLGIEGGGEDVFARFNPKSDLENAIAVALALAPVVLASGALDVYGKGVPPGPDSRAYFADIQSAPSMPQLYVAATLGWFFRHSIKIREIRVVGVKLQVQPAVLNKPGATGNETGLLFDYETDFRIELNGKIKSTRDVSTRIEGTGFVLTDSFRWVQVPSGVRELALADPGLWELGSLGKILKVTEVTLRRDPRRELLIKLRLNGNLGIVTAGDFIFAVDLEDGTGVKLQAFPSSLSLEIPSTLKGTGILLIDKDGRDVAGSLDLTVLSTGLRLFAGARVAKNDDGRGGDVTAIMATARVVFPTMIPIASSGLGLRGLDGLYAAHFQRVEDPPDPAVPAALKWLKAVEGDVVESITRFRGRWKTAFDRWSFGLGVLLGIQANDKLVNINGMLVVELPGPRLMVFAKANLLQDPKTNQEAKDELDGGVLGLLEIDVPRKEITFAALADLKFAKYISFHAPVELFFALQRLSSWHLYLGHFDNKVSARLEIPVVSLGVAGYFMSAGDVIKNAPLPGHRKDLPGFALALGCEAYVKIGGGSLYLRVDFKNYLFVSLSETLYAAGGVAISGELRLFIVSIGAYGIFDFEFIRHKNGATSLLVSGSICGRVKLVFVKLSGCVTLSIGSRPTDTTKFPLLVGSVKLVAGTNVSLHGQGMLGPIDGVIAVAVDLDTGGRLPVEVSLDAVIAISMDAAPQVASGALGFAADITRPKDTLFRIGAREGHYELDSVRLWRVRPDGQHEEFDYATSAATWWTNAQSPAGGQPIPRELALLTRNPLAANNALVSDEDLKAWIEALLGGICDPVIEPQECLFFWGRGDIGEGQDGKWVLPAHLCDPEVESGIGRAGASAANCQLDKRPGLGTPNDPLAGIPAIVGGCIAGSDSETGDAVPMLAIVHREVFGSDGRLYRLTSAAHLQADILPRMPLDLILAHSVRGEIGAINITITSRSGQSRTFRLSDTAMVRLEDLTREDVQQNFHKGCANWKGHVEAFARLSKSPDFAGSTFARALIDLSAFTVDDPASEVVFSFNETLEYKSDATVLVGAAKYIPFAELARYESDTQYKQDLIDDLDDFLNSPPIPLLEPASRYELEVKWHTVGDNEPPRTKRFGFSTTEHPPSSAAPYLLTVFPQNGERFHFLDDKPGFALASSDLLRMLEKFPGARIKVTITEDAGNPVVNSDGTVIWSQGVIVDPKALNDPLSNPPKGFIRDAIASLPSALRRAIQDKVATGELSCLGPISLPNTGVWIGFDTILRPISGYAVTLQVVDESGALWTFPKKGDPDRGDDPFLVWSFRTGLYDNLGKSSDEAHRSVCHRILTSVPTFPPDLPGYEDLGTTGVIADKDFEDAIYEALGERQDRSAESTFTVLWRREDHGLVAHALLLESSEPFVRYTETVRIAQKTGGVLTVEKGRQLLQGPNISSSSGIRRFRVSASGFSLFAELGDPSDSDVKLVLSQHLIERVSRPVHPDATITVPSSVLASRPVGQE